MNRKNWIRQAGTILGASALAPNTSFSANKDKPELTVAHITDVHIRNAENAPTRFRACLQEIKKQPIDFFLNGGDSIHAADYDNVTRESMLEQWSVWDECNKSIQDYEIYACIGNHDPWWPAPSKTDPMYGKDYVVKRLKIPHRYYSFHKKSWHFIVLDGNNPGLVLDDEQYAWLEQELTSIPANTPTLLMSHYPILGVTPQLVGGSHGDFKKLKDLFYRHRDKVKICLSGHQHLLDHCTYNNVQYCCNGSMSGFWWGSGDKESAGKGYYLETPPGYAILKLYANGHVVNEYFPHTY